MFLLQAGTIPDPSTITDTNTALIWVVGFLVAVILAMGLALKVFLKNQETQYEARITDLKSALAEEKKAQEEEIKSLREEKKSAQEEVKEINKKVMDNIFPTMQSINTTLGVLIQQNREKDK